MVPEIVTATALPLAAATAAPVVTSTAAPVIATTAGQTGSLTAVTAAAKTFVLAHPIGVAVASGAALGLGTYYLLGKIFGKKSAAQPVAVA